MALRIFSILFSVSLFFYALPIHSSVIQQDFNSLNLLKDQKPFDCSRLVNENAIEKPIALHNFKANVGKLNKKKIEYIILKDIYYLLQNKLGWSVFKSLFSNFSKEKEILENLKKSNLGQGYCESLTKRARMDQCQVVDAVSTTLGCRLSRSGIQSLPTTPINGEAYKSNISVVSLEFQHHANGIPKFLSTETIKAEVSSYYWCLQSIARVSDSSFVPALSNETTQVAPLPGWTLLAVVNSIPVDKSYRKALATINSRPSDEDPKKHDFLVSIRGSTTIDDWRVNFLYDTVPIEGLDNVRVHRGYNFMALTIWNTLKPLIVTHAAEQTLGEIVITGRSLGAAVSSLVGIYASLFVEEQKALLKTSSTSADEIFEEPHLILFVPPLIGNQAFVDYLATKTELRVIGTQYDPVSHLPCKSAPLCPKEMTCSSTGKLTDPPLALSELPGNILIQPENLTSSWLIPETHLNMLAWHVCAVPCWLSLQVPNVPLDRCFPPEKDITYETNHSICDDLSKIFI